jgi:hypothetical protein
MIRTRYWSIGRFADWLRGTPSPVALTSRGWREWREQAQQAHPVRYWLAEEGLDFLQSVVKFVPDRLYAIKYYINNRWITRTHALTAHSSHIPRGEWRDVGWRFLPCLFNELRDYVEVELAWWHVAWADPAERAKYNVPWWATGWWRVRTWRCAQAGLDNLEWQMALQQDWRSDDDPERELPSPQAETAREILALYKWWTEVYPNRPDPHEASGWSELCDRRRQQGDLFDFEDRTPEEHQEANRILDLTRSIEEQQEQEDEEMMIRLIRVRKALWT